MASGRQVDRPNGGIGRGYSQGNAVGAQQASTDRPQPDRQEEDWSTPTNIERREDTERCETSQATPLMFPLPQKKDYLPMEQYRLPKRKSISTSPIKKEC